MSKEFADEPITVRVTPSVQEALRAWIEREKRLRPNCRVTMADAARVFLALGADAWKASVS